jgi:branched-chain amino acid transport system ATP-binding protein
LSILEVQNLSKSFGGLAAVSNVNFSLDTGKITGLIGPNGSGKTTTFNMLSGLLRPTHGKIIFMGKDVTGLAPHKLCELGLGRTFQNILLFKSVNVLQNIMLGIHTRSKGGIIECSLKLPSIIREEARCRDEALELLSYVGLADYAYKSAAEVPFGTQRLLEIARALATKPKLLLLDEPGAGLNPAEIRKLRKLLLSIKNERGTTTLLVEHNMRLVMNTSDYIVVLNHGEKIAEGSPDQIQADEQVIDAYLGRGKQPC